MAQKVWLRAKSQMIVMFVSVLVLSLGALSPAAYAEDLAPAVLADEGVESKGESLAAAAAEVRENLASLGAQADLSAVNPYSGTAYAILTSDTGDRELVFFRSNASYSAGADQTVVDIMGNSYTGKVYVDFEDKETITSQSKDVPWQSDKYTFRSVRFAAGQKIRPRNCNYWFCQFGNVKSIDLSGLDTSRVTSMHDMFSYLNRAVTQLDVSGFDTSNVTNMSQMFMYASGLTSLDVSGFDTSNVTDMSFMFSGCSGLASLNYENLNTSKVKTMRGMFSAVPLSEFDFSRFDTSNCENFEYMFYGCVFTKLDLSPFDTSKATNMAYMFQYCRQLQSLDLSTFNTSRVMKFERMFDDCRSLVSLDLSSFDTSSARAMDYMMYNCPALQRLNLGPNFTFQGYGRMVNPQMVMPPAPPSDDGVHNGKWATPLPGSAPQYTPEELRDSYDGSTMAGWYVWAVPANLVSFDANGGSGSMEAIEVEAGETVSIPPCQFTLSGKGCDGWNTKPDGSGKSYDLVASFVPTEDLVLYAQWGEPRIVLDIADNLLLEVSSDGTMTESTSCPLVFSNRGNVAVRLSGMNVKPATGLSIVRTPQNMGEFDVRLVPNGGASVRFSDCVYPAYAELPNSNAWKILPGATMSMSQVAGTTGGVNLSSGEQSVSLGTILWRFTAR